MAKILDGKALNEKIAGKLKAEISRIHSKIKLVIVQVGDNPESNAYIGRKVKFGEKIGALVDLQKFPENVSQKELTSKLQALSSDSSVHGIIIQMPIPNHLDKDTLIDTIDPIKDVDGLTSVNLKQLWEGPATERASSTVTLNESEESQKNESFAYAQDDKFRGYLPATTKGVITLLDEYNIPITGKHVVIVGRSSLVGKPTFLAFLNRDATVTIAHSKTENLPEITKKADILVVAAGKPNLIGKEHVRKNQVVVDVGINAVVDGQSTIDNRQKLVGDVDFAEVEPIVKAITPVPGGVGPMTVASLFQNLLQAYKN